MIYYHISHIPLFFNKLFMAFKKNSANRKWYLMKDPRVPPSQTPCPFQGIQETRSSLWRSIAYPPWLLIPWLKSGHCQTAMGTMEVCRKATWNCTSWSGFIGCRCNKRHVFAERFYLWKLGHLAHSKVGVLGNDAVPVHENGAQMLVINKGGTLRGMNVKKFRWRSNSYIGIIHWMM